VFNHLPQPQVRHLGLDQVAGNEVNQQVGNQQPGLSKLFR
jgi:hypothetical protein